MSLITIDRSLIAPENDCDDSYDGDKFESSSKSSQSEDFMMCKGTAVGLNIHSRRRSSSIKANDEIQDHLKRIIALLRFGDYIQLIVKLQSSSPKPHQHRYCCIISTYGKQETEESSVLGVDITEGRATIGLVLPIWQDMSINLCGDGGFELITKDTVKQFKPISVQALWAAFQAVNKACQVARANAYFCRGFTHDWVNYYHSLPASSTQQIQEWLRTDDTDGFIQSLSSSPLSDNATNEEKECARMEALIRVKLQQIMYTVDLEEVTVLQLRERLEEELKQPLRVYRHFIEKQILIIYGQMDEASVIFDHVLLGTTFNASNRDELDRKHVTHILNVTREVDNFFPGDKFEYKNIRVYDDEQSSLLPYWEETHRFINEAKTLGTRCLVHCKMGISRSASTVIAYAMKENNWDLETALSYVKSCRSCVQPNPGFMRELRTYQGILEASSNRHKPIFHSDQNKSNKSSSPGNVQQNNCNFFSNVLPGNDHYQTEEVDEKLPTIQTNMKDEKFKKSETKTNSPVNSTQPSNAASSPLSMCNDNALNGINNNVVNRNQMLDLEKELFAFKRLNIPSTTVTTAMTTTTTATVTTSLNYSSNPISNMEQQPQQNNISMTLSLSDDTISSLLTSSLHRPIILWGFDNNEQGKNSGIVNSAVVAKNSHCLRQWHPDVLENIHCLDTHSVFSNCKAQKHTLSLSSSPSSTTSSLGVAVAPDLSPPISPITPTGPQHQQPNTHQLNYADHQSMTSIAWDYTSELKCLPVLEYAKLSIIPCELINIPLVTSVSILHATSMRKKEIDKLLVELNENNDENTKEIHTLEGINTEHTKVSNVLRMVSKLSDSNLFITSLSQNAKEKVSSASESSSSSFLPLLRRKQKESNDSFNICLPNTTVSSSSSSGSRDDSSSDLPTSLTTSSHLPRMILTNSTIVDTHECMNSDNGIVSETTEDSINSWKRNHTTPLMNMKMRHIEQRKSTYADLLMMTNNQNTTTNTVILPERSHSTRSSYRISSTRLRPDDSWIMNFTDCTNENVLSTSMITATDTSTATTATTMMMEMTTSSASTSMFLSSSCSKITTLHTSPSSLSPPTSNHQSVLSSSITSNPSNINSTESQIKVNNSEKLKTRSKSRDRMICKSAYGQLESPSNSLLLNKPIGTTIKTAKPTVMPISNNDIDGGGGLFTRNSSSPTLLMLNSVDSTNSTDYYVSQKSTYPPVPPCRPVRRVINWPPPPRIDPITVTESYCS